MMIVTNLADVEDQLHILDSLIEAIHDNSDINDEEEQRRRANLFTVFEHRFMELLHTVQESRIRMKNFKPAEIEEES